MPDWATISSLATAGGTLVLAVATFSSVRAASRAARIAEQALLVGVRPVLFPSRPDDIVQRLMWGDRHWASLAGEQAVMEVADGIVYMAMSLRNVGSGIAVLRAWRIEPSDFAITVAAAAAGEPTSLTRPDPASFHTQGRDLYVPAGDVSFWQAALRDVDDPSRAGVVGAIDAGGQLIVDLLYGDHEGGQRTISRFGVSRRSEDDGTWMCSVVRHWNLDRNDPR